MDTNVITESVQQFNLKWTNYSNNLLELLIDQFNKGFLTDVSLFCEGTLVKAHKMVLAACSSYFEHLFQVYNETNPLIILNGAKLKDLKILLQFMYRGEIRIHENELDSVLKLSNELQVKGLSELRGDLAARKTGNCEPTNVQEPNQRVNQNVNNVENSTENTVNSPRKLPKVALTSNTVQPEAFMLFQDRMRKKLIKEYPYEQPKDISVRLGALWKTLPLVKKTKYFEMAHETGTECDLHKLPKPTTGQEKESSKRKRKSNDIPKIPETQVILPPHTDVDDEVEILDSSSSESLSDEPGEV